MWAAHSQWFDTSKCITGICHMASCPRTFAHAASNAGMSVHSQPLLDKCLHTSVDSVRALISTMTPSLKPLSPSSNNHPGELISQSSCTTMPCTHYHQTDVTELYLLVYKLPASTRLWPHLLKARYSVLYSRNRSTEGPPCARHHSR